MKFEGPPKPTPEQIAKIEKQNVISDTELFKGGAEQKVAEEGKVELEPVGEQIEIAKEEMEAAPKMSQEIEPKTYTESATKVPVEQERGLIEKAPLGWSSRKPQFENDPEYLKLENDLYKARNESPSLDSFEYEYGSDSVESIAAREFQKKFPEKASLLEHKWAAEAQKETSAPTRTEELVKEAQPSAEKSVILEKIPTTIEDIDMKEWEEEMKKRISDEDKKKINSIGEFGGRIMAAESAVKTFQGKGQQGAQESLKEWQGHKKEAVDFAIDKIKALPNAEMVLGFIKGGDAEIIEKYDKQKEELFAKGVPATLMTPEEKQLYYDAKSRRDNFVNYLRDQYGIEKDALTEVYKELESRSQKSPQETGAEKAAEKERKVLQFKTGKGSVYTYDKEGKTTRFKTAIGEQQERQDLAVFFDLDLDPGFEAKAQRVEEEGWKVHIAEVQPDGSTKSVSDISEIKYPENLYLGIYTKEGKKVAAQKATLKPTIGYTPFDIRHFEKDDKRYREQHFGNKITEITYEEPPKVPPEKEGAEKPQPKSESPEKSKEKLISQQEKDRLIRQEKEKILQEKINQLFKEFNSLRVRDFESIFQTGKTAEGKMLRSKSMGRLDPKSAKALAKAFREGVKLLPEIIKALPELLKNFDKDLTKEASERVEKKLEQEKKKSEKQPKKETKLAEVKPKEKSATAEVKK